MGWDSAVTSATGALGVLCVVVANLPWNVLRPTTAPITGRAYVAGSEEFSKELGSRDADLEILTWGVSPERDSYLRRRRRAELTKIGAVLLLLSGTSTVVRFPVERDYGWLVVVAGALTLAAAWAPYLSARTAFWDRRRATTAARVDRAIRDLGTEPTLALPKLYELNRRQLDQYQELTRKQETSAYRLTQLASFIALAVLVAGLVVALSSEQSIDKYVGGGLSGLGSALSAFLAATFFKSHRKASKQLNRYYLEPQRTGRLLAAERIALRDPHVPPDILAELVTALMSWEMPGGAAPAPDPKGAGTPPAPVSATRFTTRSTPRPPASDGATTTTA